MSKQKILCTLGPKSLDEKVIKDLEDLGASLFRINLSHTKLVDLDGIINFISQCTKVPICIDTEGAQIRTTKFSFNFEENKTYELKNTIDDFSLRPFEVVANQAKVGDLISIDFNDVMVEVIDVSSNSIKIKTIKPGKTGENKAVSFQKEMDIPPFSEKDYKALEIASRLGIKNYAISFASSKDNIEELRNLVPESSYIISKIESKKGLRNLLDIIESSNSILIDRGDLSREISLEKIPVFQKVIIKSTLSKKKDVYVATNLLESMIENPLPTRAEINDVFNTLLDGASGLVMAAETAIGKYPVDSVSMVNKIINFYNSIITDDNYDFNSYETIQKFLK
tara:strand:+ start:24597 stop:25613 length:1017 start_codon:yes stop_codon:yes gene_type:complete